MFKKIKSLFKKKRPYQQLSNQESDEISHIGIPHSAPPKYIAPKKFVFLLHAAIEYGMPGNPNHIGVGGIGSMVFSLSLAQQQYPENIDARVIIPYYPALHANLDSCETVCFLEHFFLERKAKSEILKTRTPEGVIQYLVKPLDKRSVQLFSAVLENSMIYLDISAESTLSSRALHFSSAVSALACTGEPEFKPNVVQGHGLALHALGTHIKRDRLRHLSATPYTVYVCHSSHENDSIFLEEGITITEKIMEDFDHIAYVSPELFKESILYPKQRLISTLVSQAYNAGKTSVIQNNVLAAQFNPAQCLDEEFIFDLSDISAGKEQIKRHLNHDLLNRLGKDINPYTPLVLYVGRYSYEKGIESFDCAIQTVLKSQGTFIAMGIGEPDLIKDLMYKYRHEPSVIFFTTIEEQARYGTWVRAAADIYFVPSKEEACGLVPMEAGISGALVVSSSVGGLVDVVVSEANGVRFIDEHDLEAVLQNALDSLLYLKETGNLNSVLRLIQESATKTFDWHSPTAGSISVYFDLYQCLLTGTKPVKTPLPYLSEDEEKELHEQLSIAPAPSRKHLGQSTYHNANKLQTYINEGNTQAFYECLVMLSIQGPHYLRNTLNYHFQPHLYHAEIPMHYSAVCAAARYASVTGNFEMLIQVVVLGGQTQWDKNAHLRGYDGYYGNYYGPPSDLESVDDIIGPKLCTSVRKVLAASLSDQIQEHCEIKVDADVTEVILEFCGDNVMTPVSIQHIEYIGVSKSVTWLQNMYNKRMTQVLEAIDVPVEESMLIPEGRRLTQ